MGKIFVQVEGEGKGTEVEVISEKSGSLVLRNLNNNFEYGISIRSFELGYKAKEGVPNA